MQNPVSSGLREAFIAQIPQLRAFAISLSGNRDEADDLVQETLMKAWNKIDSFEEGTNLRAWLFTILRNTFISARQRRRDIPDSDGVHLEALSEAPHQPGYLDLQDLRTALVHLPEYQREALILVGAAGFSYQEAAEICGCAVGTLKSRVSRARAHLSKLLDGDEVPESEKDVEGAITDESPENRQISRQ